MTAYRVTQSAVDLARTLPATEYVDAMKRAVLEGAREYGSGSDAVVAAIGARLIGLKLEEGK